FRIEEVDFALPLSQAELADLWCREVGLMYLELFDLMAQDGRDLLTERPEEVADPIHAMVDRARRLTVLDLRRDDVLRTKLWRNIQGLFAEYDCLLTPSVGALPVPNSVNGETLGPVTIQGHSMERCIGWCLTHPFNFTGHPAASIPAGMSAEGLPVGLQV